MWGTRTTCLGGPGLNPTFENPVFETPRSLLKNRAIAEFSNHLTCDLKP